MNRHESQKHCQQAIDKLLDLDAIKPGIEAGNGCPECHQTIGVILGMHKYDSAYTNESYPALKQKILKRVTPLITKSVKPSLSDQIASLFRNWIFNASLATALAALLLFAVFIKPGAQNQLQPSFVELPPSSGQNNDHHFLLSMNGEAAVSVSIDNPVSLFANQECIITAPDGSTLEVRGPARLSINPRGFHLFSGYIKADVVKDETRFVATTPHLQLQVLGTVFSMMSDSRSTMVEVTSGQVFVTPDSGDSKKLSAGESAHFSQDSPEEMSSEIIPSIDSE